MNFTRTIQLEKHLAKEIALLLPLHLSTKKFGMMSVVWVKVASGFDSAKVGISVMRNSHQFEETAKKAIYPLQKDLNKILNMKKIPKIILELDRSGEILEKLEKLES